MTDMNGKAGPREGNWIEHLVMQDVKIYDCKEGPVLNSIGTLIMDGCHFEGNGSGVQANNVRAMKVTHSHFGTPVAEVPPVNPRKR